MTREEMPNIPTVQCCIVGADCICGPSERALRGWRNGYAPMPMAHEQREWCLDEIDSVEGWSRSDYQDASDMDLASGVLSAWRDYARDKGLL